MKNFEQSQTRSDVVPKLIIAVGASEFSRISAIATNVGWESLTFRMRHHDQIGLESLIIAGAIDLPHLERLVAPEAGLIAFGAGEQPDRVDEVIAADVDDEAILALLERWAPRPFPAAARRQLDTFGAAAITPLLQSLRDRLTAAVAAPLADARAGAHQLAGLAGLLGFDDVARCWEGLSADGESNWADARRSARLALAAISSANVLDPAIRL